MIAHLSGKLISKQPQTLVIDVSGVGYEVIIPLSSFYDIGEIGSPVSLEIYTHVREDALVLYGFKTRIEKELFVKLTSVSGVGPKVAITLLSGLPPDDLIRAIESADLTRLSSIPGIGKKTAERLSFELREKLGSLAVVAAKASSPSGTAIAPTDRVLREDIVSALVNLGWGKPVAEKAADVTLRETTDDRSFENLLKQSMRRLYR